jgi:hypothetical protein
MGRHCDGSYPHDQQGDADSRAHEKDMKPPLRPAPARPPRLLSSDMRGTSAQSVCSFGTLMTV